MSKASKKIGKNLVTEYLGFTIDTEYGIQDVNVYDSAKDAREDGASFILPISYPKIFSAKNILKGVVING